MKSARRPAERAMASPIAPTSSDLHRRVDDWLFRHQMEPSTPSCGITRGYDRRYDVHITRNSPPHNCWPPPTSRGNADALRRQANARWSR